LLTEQGITIKSILQNELNNEQDPTCLTKHQHLHHYKKKNQTRNRHKEKG